MQGPVCPICHQPMKEWRSDTSQSKKTGKHYTRTFYECQDHDTWGTLEIPKHSEEKQGPTPTVAVMAR